MKAWNNIAIDFHQEMSQEYSTIVQIIVKADRRKPIAWRSVSCKMTCYYIPDVKTLQILSLHFVPTLQSAVYSLYFVSGLQSALCILYQQVSVAPIQSIFGYIYLQSTHNLSQNTCEWGNSTFSFFPSLTFFSPFGYSFFNKYVK